jgi:hypothetical protein
MMGLNTVSGPYYQPEYVNATTLDISGDAFQPFPSLSAYRPAFRRHAVWRSDEMQPALGNFFLSAEGFAYPTPLATRLEEAKAARAAIEHFAGLRNGWDGYGASPILQAARDNAVHFISLMEAAPSAIPLPEISPKSAGTISFEWETPHTEIYIEIGNTRYSGFIKPDQQQPTYLQGRADSLDQQILALIQGSLLQFPAHSRFITEIHISARPHELLAA